MDKDSYLLELSRYLHLNPVRARMAQKPEEYPYSSYRTYISGATEDILKTEAVLGLLPGGKKESRERYREFVEDALEVELENPLKKVYGGIILGKVGFIKDVIQRIEHGQLEKEYVACRKELRAPAKAESVLSSVCRYYRIPREELPIAVGKEVRKICIYLLKKDTAATTREISELLGNMSSAAVARAYQRFVKELEFDDRLARQVKVIREEMSYVGV